MESVRELFCFLETDIYHGLVVLVDDEHNRVVPVSVQN